MLVTKRMEEQFTQAAAKKLGCEVTFSHWQEHKTGAAIPVFKVPANVADKARSLGLTVAL
jgi:hypothetical protein